MSSPRSWKTPDETLVEAAFPVSAGLQYKLSDLQLAGNHCFPRRNCVN